MMIHKYPAGNCFYKKLIFITLNLMKWNISVIRRKETKKYFDSTGEGTWNRPVLLFMFFQEILEWYAKEGTSPVLSEQKLILSKMLNVY